MSNGFIQLNRSDTLKELLKYEHNCFILLTVIAARARRTNTFNVFGLKPGQAFLGDYKEYGLTHQQYRTAMKKLENWKFITTKTTNKGTIATLLDTRVYDINITEDNKQANNPPTNKQQTGNKRVTTNKNVNNYNIKISSPAMAFKPVCEAWNKFAKKKANQDDHNTEQQVWRTITDSMNGCSFTDFLAAIENYKSALTLPKSQAWEFKLYKFALEGFKKFLPGVFDIDNYDKSNFESKDQTTKGPEVTEEQLHERSKEILNARKAKGDIKCLE